MSTSPNQLLPIESPNGRVARLKKLLAKPPSRCAWLVLVAIGNPPMPLQEWPREQIVPGIAHDIDALIAEHGKEEEQQETQFLLSFADAERKPIGTHKFSYRKESGDALADMAANFDGSASSQLAQLQKFCEAMMRVTLSTQQYQLAKAHELADRAMSSMDAADSRADALHKRIRELEERNAELAGMYTTSEGSSEPENLERMTQVQERAVKLFDQMAPALMQMAQMWLAKQASGGNLPGAGGTGKV